MHRQPGSRTSTPRTTYHPRPDERYNWPAEQGAGQTDDGYNNRPTCEAMALTFDPPIVALKLPDYYINMYIVGMLSTVMMQIVV